METTEVKYTVEMDFKKTELLKSMFKDKLKEYLEMSEVMQLIHYYEIKAIFKSAHSFGMSVDFIKEMKHDCEMAGIDLNRLKLDI